MTVLLVDNLVAKDRLATLRNKDTRDGGRDQPFFRAGLALSRQLIEAAVSEFGPSMPVEVYTPLLTSVPADGVVITERAMAFIAIRRAGCVLAEVAREFFPNAWYGEIDLYRDEVTLAPIEGPRHNLPLSLAGKTVFLLDPMLATGGSAIWAIERLKALGATRIVFVGWVSAPAGLDRILREYPDAPVVLAARDPVLNDIGYIEPGLGDAGDRLYGKDRDEHGNPLVRTAAKVLRRHPYGSWKIE